MSLRHRIAARSRSVGLLLDRVAASSEEAEATHVPAPREARSGGPALGDFLEALPEATLGLRADGVIEACNRAAGALFGVPREALAGASLPDLCADPEAALVALEKARARGAIRGVALAARGADGAARDIVLAASVLAGDVDGSGRLVVTLHDATASRLREAEIRKEATYARSLLEAAADPLFAIGPDGRLTDVNEAAVARSGVPRAEAVGLDFSRLFVDAEAARQACERTLSDGSVAEVPLQLRHRNGSIAHVAFSATLYRDAGGSMVGLFASARDVTAARSAARERDAREWTMAGIARLNGVIQDQTDTADLARRIISELCGYTGAQVGAFFAADDAGGYALIASHAYTRRKQLSNRFVLGEGIIGQAALERRQILITDIPEDYVRISSGLGEASPRSLCVTPLVFENAVKGLLEIASFSTFGEESLEYLKQAGPMVAVALEASQARARAAAALSKAQQLAAELEVSADELRAQQEALRNANAELEEQTAALRVSEQRLKNQQSDLELANSELGQKNELLERQRNETEQARKTLAAQAQEVALASKYKSEFLANMSHELRTPLNSLLLLARSLRDNASGNLTPDQVESASVIFGSGSDLLNLINEILDLSKIEAGKMELRPERVELADIAQSITSQFDHMARAQGLTLSVVLARDVPSSIVSDAQRLGQVVKNLLGNAIKFTEKGGVTVTFARPEAGVRLARTGLDPARAIAIHVSDTGIGIPADKQRIIFEAFQQADSGDRRRFGGTGLGLSISRELAALLGGEIQLASEPGRGSTFTIFLPLEVQRTGDARGGAHGELSAPRPLRAPSTL